MNHLLSQLKTTVIEASSNPSFIHHKWFVEYHLNIVEQISLELCELYLDADKDLVLALVWIHDYGKIVEHGNEKEATHIHGPQVMHEIGFEQKFVDTVFEYIQIFDAKEQLEQAPLEIQIVSSADGASHLVGPFYEIYWYEHPEEDISTLLKENLRKKTLDWEKKVILPEVKQAFKIRNDIAREESGVFPERFLT